MLNTTHFQILLIIYGITNKKTIVQMDISILFMDGPTMNIVSMQYECIWMNPNYK